MKKDRTSDVDGQSASAMRTCPPKGWYSGDAHIHVTRDEVADPKIWGFVAAEDVHVGNLLEMGNIVKVYFNQPKAWGKASRFERDGHFIVSGPGRPAHRALRPHHPSQHQSPIAPADEEYFLYHKVFEDVASARAASPASRTWAGTSRAHRR